MESFSYIDIFATKGIEYVFIIGVLLLFILFWRMLYRPDKTIAIAEATAPAINSWFQLPEKLLYHQGHSWALPESDNIVTVGIDDFAQKLVGKIGGIRMPESGSTLTQGGKAWELVVDEKHLEMVSPVNGEIVEVNDELADKPQNLNNDPYGKGWLLKVRLPTMSADMKNLLSGELAKKWLQHAQENLIARMTDDEIGYALPDGGIPVDGMAKVIDPEKWDDVVKENFMTL